MKVLDHKAYGEIRTWIHRNARAIDLAIWEFFYEKGDRQRVLKELSYYQNQDGGFGNGLEADCWNPESSPYATMTAIGILGNIGFDEPEHPMVQGILDYLEHGPYCDEDGWFFTIPSNNKYARAPWHTFDEEGNRLQSMGVTAGLAAFVLKTAHKESGVYQKAWTYAKQIMSRVNATTDFGEMGAGGVAMLLAQLMESGLISPEDGAGLMGKMGRVMNDTIEREPEKWAGYTPRPSQFIPAPASPLYKGNEEIVEKELDYLIDTRNPGGVWNITWTWFDLRTAYAREFAISENWWMARVAVENLGFLMRFGRVKPEEENNI